MVIATILGQAFHYIPGNVWVEYKFFWLGLVVILITGILDDVRGISSWVKFIGQGISAALLIMGGCWIQSFGGPLGEVLDLSLFSIPFSFFMDYFYHQFH